MKKLKFASMALLLTAITVMVGCKGKTPAGPTEEEQQLALLAQTWKVSTDANAITLDGQADQGDWTGFQVVFTSDKKFTATNVSQGREVVWPASGTWAFAGTSGADLNTVKRDDGVDITIDVSESTLKMSFTYTAPGGKVSGTEGAWVFNMTK